MLNISKILIIPKIPNAIGEIIEIAFVNEAEKIAVKSNPTINMDSITPNVTTRPR